jgi:hypothetical protein
MHIYQYMPARSYSDACYWLTTDRSRAVYVVVARETCNNIYRSNSNSNHAAYTLYCTVLSSSMCPFIMGMYTAQWPLHSYVSSTPVPVRPFPLSLQFVAAVDSYEEIDRIGSDRIGSSGGRPASMGMANTRQRPTHTAGAGSIGRSVVAATATR